MADPISDDVALDVRRPAPVASSPRIQDWRYPATAGSVGVMRGELRPFLAQSGLPDVDIDDLILAASEAAANGIEHAVHPTEPYLDVRAEVEGRRVRIVVRDYGRWTTRPAHPADRGRGLHLMTMLAAVSLTSGPLGTSVTLRNLADGRSGS